MNRHCRRVLVAAVSAGLVLAMPGLPASAGSAHVDAPMPTRDDGAADQMVGAVEEGGQPTQAANASAQTVTISGHGWGHGRGMGQYGALGYATDYGWSYSAILDHYYGGTRAGNVGNPEMTVELLATSGRSTVVQGVSLTVNGVPRGNGALRVDKIAPNRFSLSTGPGCAGPWALVSSDLVSGAIRIGTNASPSSYDNLLQLCDDTGRTGYRGQLSVVDHAGKQLTINHLDTESYLRGVVPREMPASWGDLNGGAGMNALRAQAVSARSYAVASSRPLGAKTCDSTACQVYGGAFREQGGRTVREDSRTDRAIADTAGQVRMTSAGATVRTEFSSSTGGWAAGGTFPAVEDLGDATARNGRHNWTVTMTKADVAARLGIPEVSAFQITQRNGLGAEGGRVLSAVISYPGGSVTRTGDQLRSALGLNSDWFSVSMAPTIPRAAAENLVRQLYRDVLGREADSAGLAIHADLIIDSGDLRSAIGGRRFVVFE